MVQQQKPPTTLGLLLGIFGLLLIAGGIWLMSQGASAYFAVIGVGHSVTGFLLFKGRKMAVPVYGVTLAVIVVWSFLETKASMAALVPRIAIPLFIAIYLSQARVRATLS